MRVLWAMTIQEKFGQRVKELRLAKNLSQEKLANIAEIDRTYMTSLENGRRNVSLQNIDKIINALGVSFKDFFDDAFENGKKRKK
jgi:transcriptional regulator with XRE-family HTH domain